MIFATWRQGCRYVADAQKVYEEITAIGAAATTKQILDKARDENTELHKCFDWNDTEAAEKRGISLAALSLRRPKVKVARRCGCFTKQTAKAGISRRFLLCRTRANIRSCLPGHWQS